MCNVAFLFKSDQNWLKTNSQNVARNGIILTQMGLYSRNISITGITWGACPESLTEIDNTNTHSRTQKTTTKKKKKQQKRAHTNKQKTTTKEQNKIQK